ncbi:MAG TPA: hypothetical protein VFG59_15895 [Anaeromyxobacter sp.]|nr:hypothetical protein [Anaeromyxobacter sp.]
MPRPAGSTSIDALVRGAMDDVVRRASAQIARSIAEMAAAELTRELEAKVAGARRGSRHTPRRPPRREMTRWAADRRARRVPTFVIEQTGLKTKKQIVAKYGDNAVFEKGKAAPKAHG